jgi:hypothetical protein
MPDESDYHSSNDQAAVGSPSAKKSRTDRPSFSSDIAKVRISFSPPQVAIKFNEVDQEGVRVCFDWIGSALTQFIEQEFNQTAASIHVPEFEGSARNLWVMSSDTFSDFIDLPIDTERLSDLARNNQAVGVLTRVTTALTKLHESLKAAVQNEPSKTSKAGAPKKKTFETSKEAFLDPHLALIHQQLKDLKVLIDNAANDVPSNAEGAGNLLDIIDGVEHKEDLKQQWRTCKVCAYYDLTSGATPEDKEEYKDMLIEKLMDYLKNKKKKKTKTNVNEPTESSELIASE